MTRISSTNNTKLFDILRDSKELRKEKKTKRFYSDSILTVVVSL